MSATLVIIKDRQGNQFKQPLGEGLEIYGMPTGFGQVREIIIEEEDGTQIRTGIKDSMISTKTPAKKKYGHVRIIKDRDQGYKIMDTGSSNGTWIVYKEGKDSIPLRGWKKYLPSEKVALKGDREYQMGKYITLTFVLPEAEPEIPPKRAQAPEPRVLIKIEKYIGVGSENVGEIIGRMERQELIERIETEKLRTDAEVHRSNNEVKMEAMRLKGKLMELKMMIDKGERERYLERLDEIYNRKLENNRQKQQEALGEIDEIRGRIQNHLPEDLKAGTGPVEKFKKDEPL